MGMNGFGIALFGTESIFLAASRSRSNASGPSIISAVPIFMALVYLNTSLKDGICPFLLIQLLIGSASNLITGAVSSMCA